MKLIYLDNNATTRMREEVLEAMLPYYKETYGNASSVHEFGRTARRAVDEARAKVADFLGAASKEEVIFTSGGTDCRFWRQRGVPAVAYGPKVYAMGAADERVPVEDLLTTAKVHVGTIIDFLSTT